MEKVNRTSLASGLLVGIGVIVNTSAENRYVGAMLFSLALLTIIHCGLQLYTGRIGYFVDRKHSPLVYTEMLFLNFIGSFVVLLWLSCQNDEVMQKFLDAASAKFSHSYGYLFVCGLFCGVLMFVAVHCRNTVITVFCIMAFILSGFEHCVADFPYFVVCSGGISLYLKFLCIIAGNSLGSILARILILRKEKETKIEE